MKLAKSYYSSPVAFVANLLLAYLCFALCRFAFLFENWTVFAEHLTTESFVQILKGGWMFDTSAILYTHALYALLMLFPIHYKEEEKYQSFTKSIYLLINSLCIFTNLADAVYFQYTGRRTTATIFQEFSNENNLGSVLGIEFLNHWYLVIVAILLIGLLSRLYVKPVGKPYISPLWFYYTIQVLSLGLFVPLCIAGMRGGMTTAVRPITLSNANQYVNRPTEATLVLNTPFSMIRTIGKKAFINPGYFSEKNLEKIYTPLHQPKEGKPFTPKNVVVLIVESFGREYIGALNKELGIAEYPSYTPFVDSLVGKSLSFRHTFGNGRKSIDGMPSILSSIPMFIEPFFLTSAAMNSVSSVAGELNQKGYYSAFFHGADNGSMGFQAFARAAGFSDYFGRTEFNQDPNYNGDKDFDGMWAIWDEEFLQFFADKINDFEQPFVTAVFTASSHHPFKIPERYKNQFPEGELPIHKCIAYTDYALKRFFEKAAQQPWFNETLFVLSADHTNQSSVDYYQTDLGMFQVPILFYAPGDSTLAGYEERIAQQIDIMPTILSYVGYDKPYIAFGSDLLSTPNEDGYAVNYLNGVYQYVKGDYLLQFDGATSKGFYQFKSDSLLQKNLLGQESEQAVMEQELKAIIQQYMERMNNDEICIQSK
ncbi:MAG: LTA synthase family protein [Phocaeicola sp.]